MLMDQQKKMALRLISSTTNDWPQIDDDDTNENHTSMMMTGSTTAAAIGASIRLMEKPGQDQLQQQKQALKCPRCDSSNTKFCYYNNYSLSQPRHFCKACKRYWTRGGTLRNVPVGGGCRKNKRLKRPSSATTTTSAVDNNNNNNGASYSASSAPTTTNPNPQIDLAPNHMNPTMFYQPDHQHMGININPFTTSGFDQFASLGLGFGDHHHQRFNPTVTNKQIQDLAAANSIFNSTSYSAAPTMASVLASKFIRANNNTNQYFQNLLPFEDLQIAGNGEAAAKEVKEEEAGVQGGRMAAWISSNTTNHEANNIELSSDPSLYYNLGANNWHDPGNLGSSVSSLI